MNNKTNKLRNAILIASFWLLNTSCYGQTISAGTDKKPDLSSFYNETKLCNEVKKIRTELGNSNKSKIIGEKIKTTIDEEKMIFYVQEYRSLIEINHFEGKITKNKASSFYYEYMGFLKADPFENGIYQKEFELISSLLETCLNNKTSENNISGLRNTFIIDTNAEVAVELDRDKSKMWIAIKVFFPKN